VEIEGPLYSIRVKKISFISTLSFLLCIGAVGTLLYNFVCSETGMIQAQNVRTVLGTVTILLAIVSLLFAIIDICHKNHKKILSIISLVISGGILILFAFIILTLL
jgi:uncharacterized membrane protein (DUF373 family)